MRQAHRLRQEMNTLARRQLKALRAAMVEGMTREQAEEYDKRHRRIAQIMNTLDGGRQ